MTAQDQHTNQFVIAIDGSPIGDDVASELLSVVVETNLTLPDLVMLTFRDQHRDLLQRGGFRVGAEVMISVFSDDHAGGEKLVDAEVTALEMEVEPQGTFTIVRGLDRSHRLQRRRVTTSHVDITYSDVAQDLAQQSGLKVGTIDATRQVHHHIAQVNATDWSFLKGLASEVGFEMGIVDGKFHFRAPPEADAAPEKGTASSTDPLQLTVGVNLLRCRATVTAADQVQDVEVRGWDPVAKEAVVGRTSSTTASAQNGSTPSALAGAFKSRRRVSVDVPYATQSEVDAAATALSDTVAASFAELEGVARGNPALKAGESVSLGLAKQPFEGKYVLSSTRHTWTPDEGYLVTFVASGSRDRSIHGLIAGSGDGTASRPGLMSGVAIAVVVDVQDPEKLHRVRLRLPWLDDDYVSDWARTSHAGAGKDRGWLVLPEVGDEVLVAFQHGDLRRPFVLGGLYNGVDAPGAAASERLVDGTSGSVDRRTFVSRTGHRLVFVDENGKLAVEIGSRGEMRIESEDDMSVTCSKGALKIESEDDLSITSAGDVKIEGRSVSVSASSGLTLDGGPTTTVKGSTVKIN